MLAPPRPGQEAAPPGAGVAALRLALALAASPRRVRLGTAWVKDATGQVDRSRTPASLEPGQFARWLRAETLAQLRQVVAPTEKFRREARRPRKSRELALALLGEYTHALGHGPEGAWIARQTLADLLALGSDRERAIVRLCSEVGSITEIAVQLGCTDRTVRRRLDALYRRACAAGILEPGPGNALDAALHELRAANEAALAKTA